MCPCRRPARDPPGSGAERRKSSAHQRQFASPGVRDFAVADLALSPLPGRPGDVIMCRQALQHLNAHDVLRVLHQFLRSGAQLLLTTSYELRLTTYRLVKADENYAPQQPGKDMFFIDLLKEPFDLPPMLEAYVDNNRTLGFAKDEIGGFRDPGFIEWFGVWELPLQVQASNCSRFESPDPHRYIAHGGGAAALATRGGRGGGRSRSGPWQRANRGGRP